MASPQTKKGSSNSMNQTIELEQAKEEIKQLKILCETLKQEKTTLSEEVKTKNLKISTIESVRVMKFILKGTKKTTARK